MNGFTSSYRLQPISSYSVRLDIYPQGQQRWWFNCFSSGGLLLFGFVKSIPREQSKWNGRVSYPFSCTSLVQPQKHEEDSTSGSILVRKLLQFLFTVNLRQETIKKNKWDLHKVAAANKKKDVSTFPPSTLRCYVKIYIRRRRRNNNNYTFLRCCCKVLQAADFRK